MGRHAGTQRATGLAFYGFLSLFPTAVLAVSVASIWFPSATVIAWLGEQLRRFLLPEAADIVRQAVAEALQARGTVTVVAVIGLLYSGSGFLAGLSAMLDAVWEEPSRRFFLLNRLIAAALTLVAILVLVVSALLTSVALHLWPSLLNAVGLRSGTLVRVLGGIVVALLTLGLDVCIGYLFYRFLPFRRAPRRAAWFAAIANGVAWNVLKVGFSLYLSRFARYGLVYGTLSGVIGVLFWAQFASLVFVYSAELSAVIFPRTPKHEQ